MAQLCPTLCDPMDYTFRGILQARILEWRNTGYPFPSPGDLPNPGIEPKFPMLEADSLPAEPQGSPRILECVAYAFSRGSSPPKNWTRVSCIAGGFFTNSAIREPCKLHYFISCLGNTVQICTSSLSISLWMLYLDCFYVLAIVNSAVMNILVHTPFQIMVSSGYMPRNGIVGLYGSSVFSILRSLYTILHSDCTSLHSQ